MYRRTIRGRGAPQFPYSGNECRRHRCACAASLCPYSRRAATFGADDAYGWPSNAVLIHSGTSSNFSLNTVTPFGLGSAMRRNSRNLSGVNGECGAHGTNGVNGPSPHTAARARSRRHPATSSACASIRLMLRRLTKRSGLCKSASPAPSKRDLFCRLCRLSEWAPTRK